MAQPQRDKKPPVNQVNTLQVNDFSGGLNTTINGSLLNNYEAQKAINVSFEQKGTLRPRKGRRRRYDVPFVNKPVTGLGAYYKSDGTSRLLIATGDKLHYDKPHLSTKWTEKSDWEAEGTNTSNLLSTENVEGSIVVKAGALNFITSATYGALAGTAAYSYGYAFKPKQDIVLRGFKLYKPIKDVNYGFYLWLASSESSLLSLVKIVTSEDSEGWEELYCEPTVLVKDTEYRISVACNTKEFLTTITADTYNTEYIEYLNGYSNTESGKYIKTSDSIRRGIDLLFDKSTHTDILDATRKAEGTSENLQEDAFKIAVELPRQTIFQDDFSSGIKDNVNVAEGSLKLSVDSTETILSQVINQPYSTEGNGGRKLVRLNSGTLISLLKTSTSFYLYKSIDNGTTWSNLKSLEGFTSIQDVAIATNGTYIYVLYANTNKFVPLYICTEDGTQIAGGNVESSAQTVLGNCSLTINPQGTELHACWSSKNATYPNSFNIRYCKGIINGDGSVTWGSVEQVTRVKVQGQNMVTPSIIAKNDIPCIFVSFNNVGYHTIRILKRNGDLGPWGDLDGNWTVGNTYYGGAYLQSLPSACVDKDGVIHVVWKSQIAASTATYQTSYSKSIDGGITWSTPVKVEASNNNINSLGASISINNKNIIFVDCPIGNTLRKCKSVDGGVTFNTLELMAFSINPSLLDDNTSDFEEPLGIYMTTASHATYPNSVVFKSTRNIYADSGTYESDEIDIATYSETSLDIVWDSVILLGTTLTIELTKSIEGIDWTDWTLIENQGVKLLGYTKIKYRATLTASEDKATTPSLDYFMVERPVKYYEKGTWTSPVLDYRDYDVVDKTHTIVTEEIKDENQDVRTYARTSDDTINWTEWLDITDTKQLPVDFMYVQYKIELIPDEYRETTPEFTSLTTEFKDYNPRAVWESQAIDVSQSTSLINGRLVTSGTAGHGKIISESASSTDGGVTWSAWYPTLVDGTLIHPEGEHVKIRYVITNDAKIDEATLAMDGEAGTIVLTSNLTEHAQYDFTTLRDKLIIANGSDTLRKWDGVAEDTEVIEGSPPVMHILTTHLNRVWGVDAENRSRVRFSDILEPETWGAFNFMDFNPEDGDEITAMMRYGQNLIVSKQRSMAILTGNKSTNFSITWLDSEAGVAGKRGIIAADKYIVYVAQDGIRFTDLASSVVATERLVPEWSKLNQRRLNQGTLTYWKNCIYAALPLDASLDNNVIWCYDFLRNSWSIYEGWNVSTWLKFQQYGQEHLLAADSKTGQVYEVFESNIDEFTVKPADGTTEPSVEYIWRSKDFNFKYPERYKLFRSIYLDIEGVSITSKIKVDMYVDGEYTGTYSTEIPAGEGVKHTRRILPPLYNTVLGRILTLEIKTRCGIQGISIEYVVRGAVPGGEF